jgi:hypothetical protein
MDGSSDQAADIRPSGSILRGKFPVSESWTGLKISCPILNGMCRTCGLTKDQLLHLLNRVD